jgi:hypothetical protein
MSIISKLPGRAYPSPFWIKSLDYLPLSTTPNLFWNQGLAGKITLNQNLIEQVAA